MTLPPQRSSLRVAKEVIGAEPKQRAACSPVLRSNRQYTLRSGSARAARRGAPHGTGLPCRTAINCNEEKENKLHRLSAGHRKTSFALRENCRMMIERHGLNRMGFLTLTFARHVVDYKEAQKALHSLRTGVIRHRYAEYIIVMERMDSGRIHYHLLIVMADDIRTGFDFEAVGRGDYRSANPYLRKEWEYWRKTAPKYGFGRTELKPIRKSGESVSRYVAKYIEKHIGNRKPEDKGARLVRYSKGTNCVSTRFTWRSPGADLWRTKLGALCRQLGANHENYPEKLKSWYGSNWVFRLGPIIDFIKPAAYPTFWALQKDFPDLSPPPKEQWDKPQFNPNTGPWLNPEPEQARETLFTAWVVACDERGRKTRSQIFCNRKKVNKTTVTSVRENCSNIRGVVHCHYSSVEPKHHLF